jgi:hypothetical protein
MTSSPRPYRRLRQLVKHDSIVSSSFRPGVRKSEHVFEKATKRPLYRACGSARGAARRLTLRVPARKIKERN